VDIDGKRIGELSSVDLVVEVDEGLHTIKMYKSHTYDTLIGFAEVVVEILSNQSLTFRYSAPMMLSQPGHIIMSDFTSIEDINKLVKEKEQALAKEKQENDNQARIKENEATKSNSILFFWIIFAPIVIWLIYWMIEMAYIDSLF